MKEKQPKMTARPSAAKPKAAPMSGLTMAAAETMNGQFQDTALFDPFTDDLFLVMSYEQSPALLAVPGLVIVGTWQIISARTNQVVVSFSYQANDPLKSPGIMWPWNAGTAHDVGLQWTEGADVFGFRAIIEAFQNTGAGGLQSLDSFDVSDIQWFRLKLVFGL
jgi:hypothetical protein